VIKTVAMSEQPKPGLVRAIGRWSLVALAVNSIIGSGVFGLPGTLAGLLGRQSVIAVVIAGALAFVIGACFAEVASYFSEAGGPYLYARTAFGRLAGILVGWMLYLAQTAAPAANANLFVSYLSEFWPSAKDWRVLILTLLIGGLCLINIFGVRQGARTSNILTIAKLLPLLMVILAGAAVAIFHPAPAITATQASNTVWLKTFLQLVFAYGGFETALAPMGEARSPRRDAGFALFVALIGCTLIYTLIQWVVVGVLGSGAATDRPLADVARFTMNKSGAVLVSIGALLSFYGYISAKILAMPRVTFALAEQGDLPRIFSAISQKFRTPWFSIALYAAAVWGLAIFGNFVWNLTLSAIARLFYYAVVCAALVVLRHKRPGAAQFRITGGPLLSVAGVLICLVLLTQVDLSQSKILALTVAFALLNWAWVRVARRTAQA
jgi:basic amino acid/polyamine antiporter, APA family